LSNVHPASIVAQQEIFGPVLAAMTFRTPRESRGIGEQHGLRAGCQRLEREHQRGAACASQLKSGRGLGQQHDLFDAACGFGGYREADSGARRQEGMMEYLEPSWFAQAPVLKSAPVAIDLPFEEYDDEAWGLLSIAR